MAVATKTGDALVRIFRVETPSGAGLGVSGLARIYSYAAHKAVYRREEEGAPPGYIPPGEIALRDGLHLGIAPRRLVGFAKREHLFIWLPSLAGRKAMQYAGGVLNEYEIAESAVCSGEIRLHFDPADARLVATHPLVQPSEAA